MDRQQLTALPAVLDVPTAAKALGLSRTAAYELIRTGEWPTPVFRLGRLIRIPTAPILELLGIAADAARQSPRVHEAAQRRTAG
jgi:excisionase family DNA binding protein